MTPQLMRQWVRAGEGRVDGCEGKSRLEMESVSEREIRG